MRKGLRKFEPYHWVVVCAVPCEPVSSNISLFSGKLTGKFAIFRPWRLVSHRRSRCAAAVFTKFPMKINRVKLSNNRDRNRVNSEIQTGYQKRRSVPFSHVCLIRPAARRLSSLVEKSTRDMSNEIGVADALRPGAGSADSFRQLPSAVQSGVPAIGPQIALRSAGPPSYPCSQP